MNIISKFLLLWRKINGEWKIANDKWGIIDDKGNKAYYEWEKADYDYGWNKCNKKWKIADDKWKITDDERSKADKEWNRAFNKWIGLILLTGLIVFLIFAIGLYLIIYVLKYF